jgi:hypothetical protein
VYGAIFFDRLQNAVQPQHSTPSSLLLRVRVDHRIYIEADERFLSERACAAGTNPWPTIFHAEKKSSVTFDQSSDVKSTSTLKIGAGTKVQSSSSIAIIIIFISLASVAR